MLSRIKVRHFFIAIKQLHWLKMWSKYLVTVWIALRRWFTIIIEREKQPIDSENVSSFVTNIYILVLFPCESG